MEWYTLLLILFAGLVFLMLTGLPIAFSFLLVSLSATFFLMGPFGVRQLILGMYDQTTQFALTPIPFFMIMGEVFYQSGLVTRTLKTAALFVKRVPGRLSVITMLGGGVFSALSGSVVATTAMVGSIMAPEMTKRGYSKMLTTGTIMGSGSLAMVIPPSALAVLLGSISGISVGQILIGAIFPGIMLFLMYLIYIVVACTVRPSMAPVSDADEVENATPKQMVRALFTDLLPLAAIFLLVMGLIFMGLATPTESAAIGALGAYILTIFYRKFSLKLVFKTLVGSLRITGMILLIIASSAGFSQILSMSGASRQAVVAVMGISDSPNVVLFLMLSFVLLIGLFMEQTAVMMITLPIFMPIVLAFEIHTVWFAILYLICLQICQLTPPVGLALFAMKGVSPPEILMKDIYLGAVPFVIMNIIAILIMTAFPEIITYLPAARL
ncbi:MAG: TRAP transporter large permease subunit [Oscillospiraceae bacterium]|nr:TRAP transporter large permease subunit [Oscillospiraceae bacterium]